MKLCFGEETYLQSTQERQEPYLCVRFTRFLPGKARSSIDSLLHTYMYNNYVINVKLRELPVDQYTDLMETSNHLLFQLTTHQRARMAAIMKYWRIKHFQ